MNVNHPNRNQAQRARPGFYWCLNCDGDLVAKGRKCPKCGKCTSTRRPSKEAPDADEQLARLRDPEPSPQD